MLILNVYNIIEIRPRSTNVYGTWIKIEEFESNRFFESGRNEFLFLVKRGKCLKVKVRALTFTIVDTSNTFTMIIRRATITMRRTTWTLSKF